jgi:hypothetical protein
VKRIQNAQAKADTEKLEEVKQLPVVAFDLQDASARMILVSNALRGKTVGEIANRT